MEWRDKARFCRCGCMAKVPRSSRCLRQHMGGMPGWCGGASRRIAPLLQPGAQLDVTWRARLDDHIGAFTVEPVKSRAGVLGDRLALAGLNAVCAMARMALPEREPHAGLYAATVAILDALETAPDWPARYLRWEVLLLEELGFGLDLSSCAVTGTRDGLAFVSPKTGRAVSREGAGGWAERLFPLPECLMGQGPASRTEIGRRGWRSPGIS